MVGEHGGRVFGASGDSVICELQSAVQAVRCAVAIQRSLSRHNKDRPADRRLEFRIGINLGDVVVAGEDLLGDGVNVAARLQQVAAPAGICISGTIHDQIHAKVTFPIVAMGERSLKNIPRPVPTFRVDWRLEDAAESGILTGQPVLPDKPSIAVLPFVNMSGDRDQEYFADGITEDIITALSRHRWFFVIARNSCFSFKGRAVDIKQVAAELGVRYVVEGSVRKAGNRVRVTAQLIDAETGAHLWAERYDRDYGDVFAIQDEMTESIAGAIEPELVMSEGRRSGRSTSPNLDAYDCYMRGQWYHYQFTAEDIGIAEGWLSRAIELDPGYAPSHMALARALLGRCLLGWSQNVEADRQRTVALAERAVALDDRDPYCHYAAFGASILSGRLPAAIAAAQRAIDLNPNFALGHYALGWSRIYAGRFEDALEPVFRAIRLSPNDPLAFMFLSRIAHAHYHLGNYEEAVHFGERAVAVRRIHLVMMILAASLAMADRIEEARTVVDELLRLAPPDPVGYWRSVHPYANPAHRAQLMQGLHAAGFSETA
jgi:TolB-like protein